MTMILCRRPPGDGARNGYKLLPRSFYASVPRKSLNTSSLLHISFIPHLDARGFDADWCRIISGLTVGFGQWQEYLQGSYLSGYSESNIAWIGTVQGFIMVVVGIFAGPAYDLGYLRSLVAGGGALVVAGFVAAGSATTFAETLLSLGFCVGLGAGCFYTPSLAHVTNCFEEKRSLALGIAASGGSVGMNRRTDRPHVWKTG